MAITHGSAVRGDLAQAVLDAVDGGTGAGKVVVMTAADAVLATIALQDPSYSRSGAVLTALGVPLSTTATGTGTAAKSQSCGFGRHYNLCRFLRNVGCRFHNR